VATRRKKIRYGDFNTREMRKKGVSNWEREHSSIRIPPGRNAQRAGPQNILGFEKEGRVIELKRIFKGEN